MTTLSTTGQRHESVVSTSDRRRETERSPLERGPVEPFGCTVIVASHLGRDRLRDCLSSVAAQDVDTGELEVVVVTNGPRDGSDEVLEELAREHPNLQLRWFHRARASAGEARTLGIAASRFKFVTFLDDDDRLEVGFVRGMLELASDDVIVAAGIHDVDSDGGVDTGTTLGQRIRAIGTAEPELHTVPWLLGFNACKLIPRSWALEQDYDADLRSGEDLVYMAGLLRRPATKVRVSTGDGSSYLRQVRSESISRQLPSFDFSVAQRLAVIRALEDTAGVTSDTATAAVSVLVRAQVGFITRYLEACPDEYEAVIAAIETSGVRRFPWRALDRARAKDLVIAYCFAPFSDTSAIVAAKAVAERRRVVDVISNDMTGVRRVDQSAGALVDRWIDTQYTIDSPPSFAGWDQISQFASKAGAVADREDMRAGGYESVYSRALWVGSHLAAALFKLDHWSVRWTAEFSDPLRTDATGARRAGDVKDDDMSRRLVRAIESRGFEVPRGASLFELIEDVTYALADEIIFTNENQRDFMLDMVSPRLRKHALARSRVRPHPVPPEYAYGLRDSGYEVSSSTVDIAYFGSFYSNRGLSDVLVAMRNLPVADRVAVRLHLFCSSPDTVRGEVEGLGLSQNVVVNPYLPYLEFLSASRLFDALVVNDVERPSSMPINPFLPSKVSDYAGSGRPIWAIYDQGSPLAAYPAPYRSAIGNSAAMVAVLQQIVRDASRTRESERP